MFKKKSPSPPAGRQRLVIQDRTPNRSVFSYHASRAVRPGGIRGERLDDPQANAAAQRVKHALLRKVVRRGPVAGILAALLIVFCLNLFVSNNPRIVPVMNGESAVFLQDQKIYETAARAVFGKSFLYKNKATINIDRIESDIRAQFPELIDVRVSLPLAGSRPTVHIQPASPRLLLSAGNDLYILDEAGRALISAKQVPRVEKMGLSVVNDQSGLSIMLGKQALPSNHVAFITEVIAQLQAKHIDVTSVTLPAAASELDVKVSGAPYTIKFNLMSKAREQVGTYLAVRGQLEREKKIPALYIDVRVEERAYYQ
jgi:hypothetical protein